LLHAKNAHAYGFTARGLPQWSALVGVGLPLGVPARIAISDR
jgi:hypothetical protein